MLEKLDSFHLESKPAKKPVRTKGDHQVKLLDFSFTTQVKTHSTFYGSNFDPKLVDSAKVRKNGVRC